MLSDIEGRIVLSLFLACVVGSGGSGYVFQALFYILIVLLGGFAANADKWMLLNFFFIFCVLVSGVIRASAGRWK